MPFLMHSSVSHPLRRGLLGALLCWVGAVTGLGQEIRPREVATPPQVQAVYLLHLTRFVKWPDHAFTGPAAPFVIGVAGNEAVLSNLRRAAREETVGDRRIECRELRGPADLAGCHLAFISREAIATFVARLPDLANRPVLLASNAEGFLVLGGHVQFVTRSGRIRLRVAPDHFRESNLHASSQLLRVAEPVR
jgi:hypothetical protein